MPEAAIVSAARTPIGKAFRGAFNQTHGATMAGHVIAHAVRRAGVDPAEVEDVVVGSGLPEGATGHNIGRVAALRAGSAAQRRRHDDQPLLRLGPAGDLDGVAPRDRRRREGDGRGRRRVDLARAERDEHARVHRGVGAAARAEPVHADAADGRLHRQEVQGLARDAGRVLAAVSAAHGRGASRREVRRRDRPAADVEVRAGQGDEGVSRRARRPRERRGQPPRHDARRAARAQGRAAQRLADHGG